jgi:serine protease Do
MKNKMSLKIENKLFQRVVRFGVISIIFASASTILLAQEHAPPKIREAPKYLSRDEAKSVKLYNKVLPSVVTVFTSMEVLNQRGSQKQGGIGSGVLISAEHHILTAAHVVTGADKIMVKTSDGNLRVAELLFSEPKADIALLKLAEKDTALQHVELGDSDELAVGQLTYVIGSPYGLEGSFSIGYISGFRDFSRLYGGTILAEFIQTDAAINSGNSGGPVFNSQGQLIGIASRILTVSGGFQGLGFVVTINTAKQLLALEDRVWIGIESIFLNSEMISLLLNQDLEGGLLIQRVMKGSPADKAGLRGGTISAQILERDIILGGDLILEFGTQEACHSECLVRAHKELLGMDRIPVKFLRGGKIMETVINVTNNRLNFLSEK